MRLLPSDPDVATIVSRIDNGDLNLQPEFQRGEVWSKFKKQRLIDSILREWHVPPIHVIENSESRKQEVLDGQQRLAAIRDFVNGHFTVDGEIEPLDSALQTLAGLRYKELPAEWRRRFDQFTIRLFRIVDYKPSEPAELFFRLNQPSSLTGAEQRNAFFGPVRQQIKLLVDTLQIHLGDGILGFSNSRMAYDDVLSRAAIAIHRKTLAEKITSADLTELYRSEWALGDDTIHLVEHSLILLSSALKQNRERVFKFNKATLFSWLMFVVRSLLNDVGVLSPEVLASFLRFFADSRNRAMHDASEGDKKFAEFVPAPYLFAVYESRSAARVADVSSVVLRDMALWLVFSEFSTLQGWREQIEGVGLHRIVTAFKSVERIGEDDVLSRRLLEQGWGELA